MFITHGLWKAKFSKDLRLTIPYNIGLSYRTAAFGEADMEQVQRNFSGCLEGLSSKP